MKIKFSPLLAGAALLAFASGANAGQPLTDSQMDHVTAGLGSGFAAVAAAAAVSVGNFSSNTATFTNTITDQGLGTSVAQSAAAALGDSAITASFIDVGSTAAATGIFN
jgi:hypothetical protein